jgi:hypothetical protein
LEKTVFRSKKRVPHNVQKPLRSNSKFVTGLSFLRVAFAVVWSVGGESLWGRLYPVRCSSGRCRGPLVRYPSRLGFSDTFMLKGDVSGREGSNKRVAFDSIIGRE